MVVNDSLPVPLHTQHHLLPHQSRFCDCLLLLSFLYPSYRSFSNWIVVGDPFFITSYHSLQKWLNFIPFQYHNVNSVHHVPSTQLMSVRRTQTSSFFLYSFCILCVNDLKLFCGRCLVPWQSPQCSHAYDVRLLP